MYVAQAAGHNQAHGPPLNFISRNKQYDGPHSTENAVAKFKTGVVTSTTNADKRERASGEQPRITGFGKHVGNLLEALLQTMPIAARLRPKLAKKMADRQESSTRRGELAPQRRFCAFCDVGLGQDGGAVRARHDGPSSARSPSSFALLEQPGLEALLSMREENSEMG